MTLDGLTIAVDGPDFGYLAEIMIHPNKSVPVGTAIAQYAETKEEFTTFREQLRIKEHEIALKAEAEKVIAPSNKPTVKTLLRAIKNLINDGKIIEESGKTSQSCSF